MVDIGLGNGQGAPNDKLVLKLKKTTWRFFFQLHQSNVGHKWFVAGQMLATEMNNNLYKRQRRSRSSMHDALNSLIARIDRLSSEAVADNDRSILEELLREAQYNEIEINMNGTGKLVSFVKEMSDKLETPQDPQRIIYEFPPELYHDVNSLIDKIVGNAGKTRTELCILQNIILFNIAKNKKYIDEHQKPTDPYASTFLRFSINFLASNQCEQAASSILDCIASASIYKCIENARIESAILEESYENAARLKVLVSKLQSYYYVREVLEIAKSNITLPDESIPLPDESIPLDGWTDNWLDKAAQIMCIESENFPRRLEMVSNILRYMLTRDMTVTTNRELEQWYYVYETDKYIDNALRAMKAAKLEIK